MAGSILLAGGAEFGGTMAEPDRLAIELAGGSAAPIRIIPTAAAPDNNHRRAGDNGVRWFRHLGARDVAAVPLIDRESAASQAVVTALRQARLIYLLGGFPRYLGETLANSPAWQAALAAHDQGALIAGSSAGAMVLCAWYYDPQAAEVLPGLGIVRSACVLPHHNTFGKHWAPQLQARLPNVTLLGIDEATAMISTADGGWRCAGAGNITVYNGEHVSRYAPGAVFQVEAGS